jgi:uncharacterized repeat protein (TIGR01451 family)
MTGAESIPPEMTVAAELRKLLTNDTATVTDTLAENMHSTLGLYVLGGPEQPANIGEAEERIERLWTRLREFLGWDFADEISTDPIVGTTPATPEEWAEAARLIARYDERGETWYCGKKYLKNLPKLQEEADKKIRKGKGSDRYFRDQFQQPICKALARLLLKAEEARRDEVGWSPPHLVSPPPPPESPEGGAENSEENIKSESPRLPMRRQIGVATSILLLTALAIAIANGASNEVVLSPHDFGVTLQAGLDKERPEAARLGSKVELGATNRLHELDFAALVHPVRDRHGRIPPGLHLVVVIPRKSLTPESLPSAFLQVGGSSVREVGQQASDAVTISSRLPTPLGLDIPSDLRIQVNREGGTDWNSPQLLSSRWLRCSEQRCVLRLPLARFAGESGEAIRIGFQTLAFGLKKHAPLLVVDMEQRRVRDELTRDEELRVSKPGDQVLYSLYLANRGTKPAHNVVARLALPVQARLLPGSARATTTGVSVPLAIEDNLANGGVRYPRFRPGASTEFSVIVEVLPQLAAGDWMRSFWLVKSAETRGTKYYDSATTSASG